MDTDLKSRAIGLLLVVVAAACWSTSGIFINLIVNNSGITPIGLAFWRDIGTFACLLVGLLMTKTALELETGDRFLPRDVEHLGHDHRCIGVDCHAEQRPDLRHRAGLADLEGTAHPAQDRGYCAGSGRNGADLAAGQLQPIRYHDVGSLMCCLSLSGKELVKIER